MIEREGGLRSVIWATWGKKKNIGERLIRGENGDTWGNDETKEVRESTVIIFTNWNSLFSPRL